MILTLFKYNAYFLLVPDNPEDSPKAFSEAIVSRNIPTGRHFLGTLLKAHLQINCSKEESFVALEDGSLLIIGSASEYSIHTLLTVKLNEDKLRHAALAQFHKWKTYLDQQIIDILLERPQSLKDPLAVCARYTHSDAHSLWIFNPYTDVFTCAATSHIYTMTFLRRGDQSTLFAFLDSNKPSESREPTHLLCLNTELAKCKTLNRVRIHLDDTGTIAVLNLYSLQPHYQIPETLIRVIRDLVVSKYTETRLELHKNYEKIEQSFTTDYKLGNLTSFLCLLTKHITTYLSFECCSILTFDRTTARLKMVATTDAQIEAATVDNVFYGIDKSSLTGMVACTKHLQVSYDLATDGRNSKQYSEKTTLPGRSWIGVPVMIDSEMIGVVRVKNKYSSRTGVREARDIRPADIEYMESIATMLASLMQIEELYLHSRKDLKESQDRIAALNEFSTVFLHEIKTPISTFALSPLAIKRRMEYIRNTVAPGLKDKSLSASQEFLIRDNIDKIELRLTDISVMANRLKFIADTYLFDLIISHNKPKDLSVLQDIVFPVVNITKEYFRRSYDIDLKVDASSLQGLRVFADQTMLTLVLNALVDNAGKYTIGSRRPVVISGNYDSEGIVKIIVSNYGLAIESDEQERVFGKAERGRNPKAMNIPGTGVGLHLGRKIMREQKGDLQLLQRVDPVKFAMVLPGNI